MINNLTTTKHYCNVVAMQQGLDPIGHAGSFSDAIIIEAPLPWKYEMTSKSGALPQQMIDLYAIWLEDYHQGKGYPHLALVIAPDNEYSQVGMRRIMFYTRPDRLFAQFTKVEYLLPENELGALIWALYQEHEKLDVFEQYRIANADAIRDILVCTHGTVDVACAKFGYPLYKHMRENYSNEQLRVWRVSHFGGHVFAPTLMDMPIGHYWAYVEEAQAEQIVQRNGDVSAMRGHYRGWAGVSSGFEQAAECELWQKLGWKCFDYLKSAEVITRNEDVADPKYKDVCISYRVPDSTIINSQSSRVYVENEIEIISSTGNTHTYPYPQYRVKNF